MNILRIISSQYFFPPRIVFFSTEPLQPLKAAVEFLNRTLITTYKTKKQIQNLWQIDIFGHSGSLGIRGH